MKPTMDFFSGTRYAIFGATSGGRSQGPYVIDALRTAGKTPVVIQADAATVKDAEVKTTLAEAGAVDGVILLPPCPWGDDAAKFLTDAFRQSRASGVSKVWVYSADADKASKELAAAEGVDIVIGECPCCYIEGGGTPHAVHRFFKRLAGKF